MTLINDNGGVVAVNEAGLTIARGESFALDIIIYATGFDSNFIPFLIEGRNGISLADKFGANAGDNYQMVRPQSLWGMLVEDMPNFYMMIGPQSLNPVTNVTLLCEEQTSYIADLVKAMKDKNQQQVEPTRDAVESWTALCEAGS